MKKAILTLAVLVPLTVAAYLRFIAAEWLQVRRVELTTGKWPRSRHLRVMVLGDLRFTTRTRSLSRLDQLMRSEQPDLILFAGGALGDDASLDSFRKMMGGLYTPIGRYAVRASADRAPQLYSAGPAIELQGRPLHVADDSVVLCGVPFGGDGAPCLAKAPKDAYVIFLHSTPDLVESLFPRPDLYVTSEADVVLSRYAARFPPGKYDVAGTVLQVAGSFTAHGFTRPEVTLIDLEGTN